METLLLDRMQSLTELVALSCAMESCVCHANASGDVTVEIGDRLGPPVRAGGGAGGVQNRTSFPFWSIHLHIRLSLNNSLEESLHGKLQK